MDLHYRLKEAILACKVSPLTLQTADGQSFTSELYELISNSQKDQKLPKDISFSPFYKKSMTSDIDVDVSDVMPAGYVISIGNGDSKRLIVGYHGTKTKKEAKNDLRSSKIDMKFGDENYKIHEGFHDEYLDSKDSLDFVLANQVKSDGTLPPITFTGHSMGGALAKIAALDRTTNEQEYNFNGERIDLSSKPKDVNVISFGDPRVFGRDAAEKFEETLGKNAHTVHLVNDIIPVFPKSGYKHVGKKLRIKGKGVIAHRSKQYVDGVEKAIANGDETAFEAKSILDYVQAVFSLTKEKIKALLSFKKPSKTTTTSIVDTMKGKSQPKNHEAPSAKPKTDSARLKH